MVNPTPRWQPLGPAPIQDPFQTKLNVLKPWGSGQAAGAMHALAVDQPSPTGDAWLYAGSVNGGLWARPYTWASDQWGPWQWVSKPPNYQGAQSIGAIALSPGSTQRWMAVGGGNFSSFKSLQGEISSPLQLAERLSNGELRWLSRDDSAQTGISGQPIQALEWVDDGLLIVGTDKGLYVGEVDSTGRLTLISSAFTTEVDVRAIERGPSGRIYAAFHDLNGTSRGIYSATAADLRANPSNWQRLASTDTLTDGANNLRLALTNDQTNPSEDIVYLGVAKEVVDAEGVSKNQISAIHRTSWNGSSATVSWQSANVVGKIGSNAADYSNFSFAADPSNPQSVLAGGNFFDRKGQYYPGGVAAVIFDNNPPRVVEYIEPDAADGTAPHADSRDITFLSTRNDGWRIIESDDGGIYEKNLTLNAPWRSLNDGLRTTESYASDWSHLGNLMIAAMQDNSVALGSHGSNSNWLNLYSGDGSIGRFDDGLAGSDSYTRAYYSSQGYDRGEGLSVSTHDASGTLQNIEYLDLTVLDSYGNRVSFNDYDYDWADQFIKQKITDLPEYPFYNSAETSAYRAGDFVLAGTRNIYETVVPHWSRPADAELLLLPLLPEENAKTPKLFTAASIGSTRGSSFTRTKPDSWDALYVAYRDTVTKKSYLLGRQARESQEGWKRAEIYGLNDLTPRNLITDGEVISGISFNPDKPEQIYATVSSFSVKYDNIPRSTAEFNKPSKLLFSADGGLNWQTLASAGDSQHGLPLNSNLQQVRFIPATGSQSAQLFVGGYGGIWTTALNQDGSIGNFNSTPWTDLSDGIQVGLWNSDLVYDHVDNVLMASMVGQGTWLLPLNSSGVVSPAPSPASEGLRLSSTRVAQSLANHKNRKNRNVPGTLAATLVRSSTNKDSDISVELELLEPDLWARYIQLDDITPNNGRARLNFPKGANNLYLTFSTRQPNVVRPEIMLHARLIDANGAPIAGGEASITLYPNSEAPGFYGEGTGVFYAANAQTPPLSALLPAAYVNKGYSLWWYKVDDGEGAIHVQTPAARRVTPNDPDYLEHVNIRKQLISAASQLVDPNAFNLDQALQAFSNPSILLNSEQRPIGTLLSKSLGLAKNERFAFALCDSQDNVLYVSPRGFSFNPQLDNVASFITEIGTIPFVLAPANGQVFVADPSQFATNEQSSSVLTIHLQVARAGGYESGFGLFRVDNLTGGFDTNGDGEIDLNPGSVSYAIEALQRSQTNSVDGITGLRLPGYGASLSQQVNVAASNIYAAYITPNQSTASALANIRNNNDIGNQAYFTIAEANADKQLHHVCLTNGYFAFEDMHSLGDRDFNDIVLYLTPAAPSFF